MSAFTGTAPLVRLALRRERIALPAWALLFAAMSGGTAARYADLFPTAEAQASFAEQLSQNRALAAFGGEIFARGIPGLTLFKVGDSTYSLVALMALLTVVRHTRAEEEAGRAELLASNVVGRLASLTAALVIGWCASLTVATAAALGLIATHQPVSGSLAFGGAVLSSGICYASVAAVCAQLVSTSRAAHAMAGGLAAVGYALRFVADGARSDVLRWCTPQGWSHQVRPFASDRWWVLGISVVVSLSIAAVAYALRARRDLGAGFWAQRPGPAGSTSLRTPFLLAWRLQRNAIAGWTLGLALLGSFVGVLGKDMPAISSKGGPLVVEFFRRYAASPDVSIVDIYLWLVVLSLGYVAALYPALAIVALRAEELAGNTALLLASPVSRWRIVGSQIAVMAAGSALMMTALGVALGLVHGTRVDDVTGQLPRIVLACWVQLPAMWTLGGVGMLAFGVVPRACVAVAWAAYLFVQLFGEVIGPALHLSFETADAVIAFHHLPKVLSGEGLRLLPIAALLVVTGALLALGARAFRARDVVG
jgi:ABC-2 type transport system permease protein